MLEQLVHFFRRVLGFSALTRKTKLILDFTNGGRKEFDQRYEDRAVVLGEGVFGIVTLIETKGQKLEQRFDENAVEIPEATQMLACKTLTKGVVFKDNVLYAPIEPEMVQTEIDCLRTLRGQHFCVKLFAVYETLKEIKLVTNYCDQGNLLEYQDRLLQSPGSSPPSHWKMPITLIAEIAYQLLDAVNHCAQHGIIHRDIKPQNCLMSTPMASGKKGSLDNSGGKGLGDFSVNLTLIDFGSSAYHKNKDCNLCFSHGDALDCGDNHSGDGEFPVHSTYVGTPFYRSPEMFQRAYSQKTDVWSSGMVIFVAAHGYPLNSKERQRILDFFHYQSEEFHDWDALELPWMLFRKQEEEEEEEETSSSALSAFLDLLDSCLTYEPNSRPNAKEILATNPLLVHQQNKHHHEENSETGRFCANEMALSTRPMLPVMVN